MLHTSLLVIARNLDDDRCIRIAKELCLENLYKDLKSVKYSECNAYVNISHVYGKRICKNTEKKESAD